MINYHKILIQEGWSLPEEMMVNQVGTGNTVTGDFYCRRLYCHPYIEPHAEDHLVLFDSHRDMKNRRFKEEDKFREFVKETIRENLRNFLENDYDPAKCTPEFNQLNFEEVLEQD